VRRAARGGPPSATNCYGTVLPLDTQIPSHQPPAPCRLAQPSGPSLYPSLCPRPLPPALWTFGPCPHGPWRGSRAPPPPRARRHPVAVAALAPLVTLAVGGGRAPGAPSG